MAGALDQAHLLGHVQDAYHFEVPHFLAADGRWEIPQPFGTVTYFPHGGMHTSGFVISKFMVLEVVAAVIVAGVAIRLARRVGETDRPRGRLWNFFEAVLLFIRDEVARPAIGHHEGDKFLPFLWTLFFFILTCNLLGMIPWLGSPTGAIGVTAALAFGTFLVVVGSGMAKLGPVHFWGSLVPHMDLPLALAVPLKPMIFGIELFGLLVKHFVLSVRLVANMFAGHLVLAVLVAFIGVTAQSLLWYGVMPASIVGATLLSLLELFVAFLQAYIFTFLSALFIGMAVHPH